MLVRHTLLGAISIHNKNNWLSFNPTPPIVNTDSKMQVMSAQIDLVSAFECILWMHTFECRLLNAYFWMQTFECRLFLWDSLSPVDLALLTEISLIYWIINFSFNLFQQNEMAVEIAKRKGFDDIISLFTAEQVRSIQYILNKWDLYSSNFWN